MTFMLYFLLSVYSFFNIYFFSLFLFLILIFFLFDSSWSGVYLISDSYIFILLSFISLFILLLVLFSELNYMLLFLSQLLVLVCILFFFSFNLLSLYIFFELSLFPIIIMILGYGSQIEKINSSYYLIFYASFCSFPFLFVYFFYDLGVFLVYFDKILSWELVFFLSLGFLIKFPVYFLHLWLPKAHVEAPTTASILLAGLLLKLGTGGFFRILKSLSFVHLNFWFFLSFLGMILGSFTCSFQRDSKSLAAYSSITHIAFTLLCLILLSLQSKVSRLILILAHGYTSTLIFYFIGEFYHSRNTRIIYYINRFLNLGLILGVVFSLIFLSNAGVPPTLSFLSEFLSITVSLNFIYLFLYLIFLYFFVAFYYSIFFLTNFLIGKSIINIFYWSSFYGSFLVFIIFNIFWFRIIL